MANMTKGLSLIAVSALACIGCASTDGVRPGSIANLSHASAFEKLEVEATPEDQARSEVLAAPTEFLVPIEQDRFAWERARFFLENYGSGSGAPSNAVVKVVGSRRGLSSAPGPSPYTYEVFKDFSAARVSILGPVPLKRGRFGARRPQCRQFRPVYQGR